jgi:hypothetical protein
VEKFLRKQLKYEGSIFLFCGSGFSPTPAFQTTAQPSPRFFHWWRKKMMASLQAEFLRVCGSGDLERVKQLLGEGADINTQNHVCVSMSLCFESIVFRLDALPSIMLAKEVMRKW